MAAPKKRKCPSSDFSSRATHFMYGFIGNLIAIALFAAFESAASAFFWRHFFALRFYGPLLIFLVLEAAVIGFLFMKRKRAAAAGMIAAYIAAMLWTVLV